MTLENEIEDELQRPQTEVIRELLDAIKSTEAGTAVSRADAAKQGGLDPSARIRKHLSSIIERLPTPKNVLCEKLKYCQHIDSEHTKLAVAVVDVFAANALIGAGFPGVPIVTIAVYAVRERFLDAYCDCP